MEHNELDLKQALEYIEPMSLSYQEWVGVGMGLKEAGYPASVWDDWSKRDARRYHAGECARKWETFRGTDTPITAGTIVQMALTRGWQPGRTGGHELGWEDEIGAKDEPYRVVDPHWVEGRDIAEPKEWHPAQQLITYLEALFDSTENVGYVTRSFEKDGKYTMNLYERVRRGDVDQCSFGFDILDEETEQRENGEVRWTIRKVKLYEVSVVTFPAYQETSVTARKRDYEEIQKRKTEAWRESMRKKLKE